jgi:tetratricopeptide (TPR) repeat protein
MADAWALREQAVAAAAAGDRERAGALFEQSAAAAPDDAGLLNSAALHWSKAGDRDRAIALWRQAVSADPAAGEPLNNLAIERTRAGRAADAAELLAAREREFAGNAKYWSARGSAERAAGRRRDSLASYERGWAIDRSNRRIAEGRARMRLETGLDATAAYREALAVTPGEPTVIIGYGQALEVAGQAELARQLGESLVKQLPHWTDALEWLAQLRWAAGERESFTDHYAAAAAAAKAPAVYVSWCRMLAGVDRFAEAAEAARRGREALGEVPELALREAIHAGEAGDDARAGAIFDTLALDTAERKVHEARHRLRVGQAERAEALTAEVIADAPDHIGAWALRDIAWRLLGDSRHEWLHMQDGLVRPMPLDLSDDQFAAVVALLDRLHDSSTMPVGQSVREGSQTRGGLFDRHEPEIPVLEASFRRAVQAYRDQLPPRDAAHPLLRHRDSSWRFAGSWSIRVFQGGRHTEHIHPRGLVSSAAYFVVPEESGDGPQAGWLELGRPPPDLRIDLPPLYAIEPRPRECALFPSTLYHGTRRFAGGKRMTVAIDIHLDRGG